MVPEWFIGKFFDLYVRLAEEQKKFIDNKVREIHDVMSREPIVKRNVNVKNVYVSKKDVKSSDQQLSIVVDEKKDTVVRDRRFGYTFKNYKSNKVIVSRKKKVGNSKEDKLEDLGIELINKIKDSFTTKLDRLEVLESELYLLSVDQDNTLELKKIKEIEEKIKELIEEINSIIKEYNLYNKNYYMDNFIGIEDRIIEDDIINYRELLDSSSKEKSFVKEYKLLDEFKGLYGKLVEIKHDTEVLVEKNEEKTRDFDIRDKKYKNIVNETIKINDIEKECLDKINKQNKYLEELARKINIIDRHEYVTSHLRGFGELVSQSFKFIGLKLLSPLSGIIPSIAVNTLMTKKLIGEMYKNLHYEDVKHIYYSAIDYDSEILSKIVDVGYTEDLIDSTLVDIKRLKEDFMLQYNSNIPGYSDTLKKINDIEKSVSRNQDKISMVKKKLIQNKKINEDKLVKVRKMNETKN